MLDMIRENIGIGIREGILAPLNFISSVYTSAEPIMLRHCIGVLLPMGED